MSNEAAVLLVAQLEELLPVYKEWTSDTGLYPGPASVPRPDLWVLRRGILRDAVLGSEMLLLAFLVGSDGRFSRSGERALRSIRPRQIFLCDPRDPRLLRGLSLLVHEGLVRVSGPCTDVFDDETEIDLTDLGRRLLDGRQTAISEAL